MNEETRKAVQASFSLAAALFALFPIALFTASRLGPRVPAILDTARRLPVRSFLVGFSAAVAVVLLLAAANATPLFGIPALLAGAVLLVFAFLGLVAEARGLGDSLRDRAVLPGEISGGSVAIGWLVIAGLALPLWVGPLLVLFLALRGAGATILALAAGEPSRPA